MLARVGLGALVLLAACAAVEPAPPAGGPLSVSLQVLTSEREVGFVLHVTNVSGEDLELNFRSGQTFDFMVRDGAEVVWRWSDDQMFTQALRREVLPAGATQRYEAVWRPERRVEGEYEAVGMLTASDHPVTQSARIALP